MATTLEQAIQAVAARAEQTDSDLKGLAHIVKEHTDNFAEKVRVEFESHSVRYTALVEDAREAFEGQKSSLVAAQLEAVELKATMESTFQAYNREMEQNRVSMQEITNTIAQLNLRTVELEAHCARQHESAQTGWEGSALRPGKEYIPTKNLIPTPYAGDLKTWYKFKEDLLDFLDACNPGMRRWLEMLAKMSDEAISSETYTYHTAEYGARVVGDKEALYRALKNLTTGEPKGIVNATEGTDGFLAWHNLVVYYERNLSAQHGAVLADFSGMISRQAKNPGELRQMISDMKTKMKRVKDVTNEEIGDAHKRSVLVGIMDSDTRKHTATFHDQKFEILLTRVLEFVNNVSPIDTDHMQLGRMQHTQEQQHQGAGRETNFTGESSDEGCCMPCGPGWETDWMGGSLDALNTGCFNCGGPGHYARECPYPPNKGKGKGKGKWGDKGGKAKGKGKGDNWKGETGKGLQPKGKAKGKTQYQSQFTPAKGGKAKGKGPMYGSCWICGGPHFAADCNHNQIRGMWETMGDQAQNLDYTGAVPRLSACWQVPQHDDRDQKSNAPGEASNAPQTLSSQKSHAPGGESNATPKSPESNAPGMPSTGEAEWERVPQRRQGRWNRANPGTQTEWQCPVEDRRGKKTKPTQKEKRQERQQNRYAALADIQTGASGTVGELKTFITIEPEGLHQISEGEWEEIELAVDSGATETVVGECMVPSVEITPGIASKRGVCYEVANGERIPNLGEKKFEGYTEEGHLRYITAQVCEVNKALLSVKKVVKGGRNRVVFDDEGSYIEDKVTKEKMWMREDNGMYMLKMWVQNKGAQSFPWQGR